MVGIVTISTIISLYMWYEMRKTTEATKLAADAAAASSAAWIAMESFKTDGIRNDRITFDVVFKNIGKTPALDVKAGIEFTFTAPINPENLDNVPKYEPYQCPKPTVHPGILPPDKLWGTTFSPFDFHKFTPEEIQMLKNRTARFFVHMCATYRDVLSDKERITEIGGYFPSSLSPTEMGVGITTHTVE